MIKVDMEMEMKVWMTLFTFLRFIPSVVSFIKFFYRQPDFCMDLETVYVIKVFFRDFFCPWFGKLLGYKCFEIKWNKKVFFRMAIETSRISKKCSLPLGKNFSWFQSAMNHLNLGNFQNLRKKSPKKNLIVYTAWNSGETW